MIRGERQPHSDASSPSIFRGRVLKSEVLSLLSETDVVSIRQAVRKWALELKLSLVDQTKLVTAASELGRNTVIYGGGGICRLEKVEAAGKSGLRVTFEDQGPGIPDVAQALKDGFTSGNGLGLGLGGAMRLSNEFYIESEVGQGTKICILRWK